MDLLVGPAPLYSRPVAATYEKVWLVKIPGLLGIDHVGIAVADLEQALAFYRDVLGMELIHQEVNEEQGVREAMLKVGDSVIQLLAPLNQTSPIATFLNKSGPGLQQIAYAVADVAATSQLLREQGLTLLYETPRQGTAGTLINFIHPKSTGGVLVELVQH